LPSYFSPTRVVWDVVPAEALSEELRELGARRPFVLLDAAIAGHALVAEAVRGLDDVCVQRSTGGEPETSEADELAAVARREGCDVVVGIGGGSVMDLSKAVAGLVRAVGEAADYQGFGLLPGPAVPVIVMPTTAGTGSEVTWTAVLVNRAKNLKLGINSPHIVPVLALLEPRLTTGMQPRLTLSSGLDAIGHAVESYGARKATPISRALSRQAFTMLTRALPNALADGDDLDARRAMLLGSTIAGMAVFNAGTGAAHAMAYPLGVRLSVPHSEALAMLLPKIAESVQRAEPEFYDDLAAETGGDVPTMLEELVAPWRDELRLERYGCSEADLAVLATEAMNLTSAIENHPAPFDERTALEILEAVS
jgi:alcohol dehydrogenase